ncbi:hypothetical protein GF354_05750 [Candidatus Peregrinibacteria bacterium]|nr:hypothetical protein [Candidatus Peregrinibacteria bacterium]
MSRSKVDDSLRILKKIEDKPKLRRIAEFKGVNSVRPVVSIATKDSDEFWAKKAGEMSKHTLAAFVKDYKNSWPGPGGEGTFIKDEKKFRPGPAKNFTEKKRVKIEMDLDEDLFDELKKLKGNADWNSVIRKLLVGNRSVPGDKPHAVRYSFRAIPRVIQRFIKERSGEICEHPNCLKAAKHFHHIKPFALVREHDPDNILHLCIAHHDIIHLGYIDDDPIFEGKQGWKQVSGLPLYDIKNLINRRIKEKRR